MKKNAKIGDKVGPFWVFPYGDIDIILCGDCDGEFDFDPNHGVNSDAGKMVCPSCGRTED